MKISEIIEFLKESYPGLKSSIVEEKIIVSVEKFDTKRREFSDNILFVKTADEMKSIKQDISNTNFIVIKSGEEVFEYRGNYNLIYITDNVSVERVFNEVKLMIEKFIAENARISDLYSVLNLENYLEPLMDKAYKYLENPITYYDNLHNIKSFRKDKIINNTQWEKDIELGHMDFSSLKETFYLCLETLINKGELEFNLINHKCKIYTSKYEKNIIGFVAALEYNRKFQEVDYKILKTVADIIALKSLNNGLILSKNNFIYSDLFKELLEGRIKSSSELKGLLKTRNWRPKRLNRIILLEDNKDGSYEYLNYIRNRVSQMHQNFKVVCYNNYIVILEERIGEVDEMVHERIKALLANTGQAVGISDVFNDLIDMKKYFKQAKSALYFNEIFNNNNKVNYYSDFRFMDFIKQCHDNINYEEYIHPYVQVLDEYDKLYNGELGKTLFAYLENDRSVIKTSAQMNVHKNTINYRINKIKDLIGIDFNNKSEIIHIYISYKVRDLGERLSTRDSYTKRQPI